MKWIWDELVEMPPSEFLGVIGVLIMVNLWWIFPLLAIIIVYLTYDLA